MNLRLSFMHVKLGNMPLQASYFSYNAVFLFHISFLYTHIHAFCHITYQAKQHLCLLLHHLSQVLLNHPNARTQNSQIFLLLFHRAHLLLLSITLKGSLAKSQTSVALTATVPHVSHRRDTEISPSSWKSNWSDSGQHNVKHSLLKAVTCGNLTCLQK